MMVFGFILYFLFVIAAKVSFYVLVGPIIIGLVIIAMGNIVRKSKQGRFAPIWWDILSGLITVLSTALLWKDIFNDAVDYGDNVALIFQLLVIYGVVSVCLLGLIPTRKRPDEEIFIDLWNDEEIDEDVVDMKKVLPQTSSKDNDTRLSRVRKNITVDKETFDVCGITFKYNLVEEYERLQLNVEMLNTKAIVQKYGEYVDFVVKVNIYDKENNLLCVESLWFEYSELKQGYASDYFYFMNDNMDKANSMKIYAVIFGEDDED